ncbi:MAG: carbohydrate ABC transporter permease [Caldilineaceae bacterium]
MTLRTLYRFCTYLLLVVLLFWLLFPIYWIFIVSIKPGSLLFTWPPTYIPIPPTLGNYSEAIKTRPLIPTMTNSLIVMVVSTATSVLIASLAAFALARYRFRGREVLRYGILFIRMLPAMIIAIPLFVQFQRIGLFDSLLSLIIVYTAFNLPFNVWMLTGFLEEVPRELEDAARIDGCNAWQLYSTIFMPLVAPGLVASIIFCMLLAWNEFQFALILTYTLKSQTLPIVVAGMWNDRGIYFGQMAASGMITILPVLALGLFIQRYLVQGLTAGAVKG